MMGSRFPKTLIDLTAKSANLLLERWLVRFGKASCARNEQETAEQQGQSTDKTHKGTFAITATQLADHTHRQQTRTVRVRMTYAIGSRQSSTTYTPRRDLSCLALLRSGVLPYCLAIFMFVTKVGNLVSEDGNASANDSQRK
jgi:hypothetical protein